MSIDLRVRKALTTPHILEAAQKCASGKGISGFLMRIYEDESITLGGIVKCDETALRKIRAEMGFRALKNGKINRPEQLDLTKWYEFAGKYLTACWMAFSKASLYDALSGIQKKENRKKAIVLTTWSEDIMSPHDQAAFRQKLKMDSSRLHSTPGALDYALLNELRKSSTNEVMYVTGALLCNSPPYASVLMMQQLKPAFNNLKDLQVHSQMDSICSLFPHKVTKGDREFCTQVYQKSRGLLDFEKKTLDLDSDLEGMYTAE